MIQNTPILELWKALQEQLKVVFSNDIFNTWFKPLECDPEAPEGKMILLTSNEFATLWLQNNYQEILEKKLAQLTEHPLVLEFKTHETKVSATAPQAAITGNLTKHPKNFCYDKHSHKSFKRHIYKRN